MIRQSKTFLAAALFAMAPGLTLPAAAADTYAVDKTHSEVLFSVKHLVSRVSGQFQDFAGTILIDRAKPEASSAEFTIKATSISTKETRRDDHLRSPDFFDVAKFPEITFKSTKVTPKEKDAFEVTGDLTMHGVTKPVVLAVGFLGDIKDQMGNDKAGFEATTTLNRKDFGILWNKALDQGGYVLGDDVKIVINLEAAKPKAAPAAAPVAK
jgi:polyisoprenoid-binding protein YceI